MVEGSGLMIAPFGEQSLLSGFAAVAFRYGWKMHWIDDCALWGAITPAGLRLTTLEWSGSSQTRPGGEFVEPVTNWLKARIMM